MNSAIMIGPFTTRKHPSFLSQCVPKISEYYTNNVKLLTMPPLSPRVICYLLLIKMKAFRRNNYRKRRNVCCTRNFIY